MSRWNARLVVPTLAIAMAASLCLATDAVSKGAPAAEPKERLTLEGFNKLMKAEQALAGTSRDSSLEHALAMHGDPDTLRRWAAQLDADKKFAEPIKAAGMTTREYTRTLVAVLQAYAVSGLQKQSKPVPENLKADVPSENIAFVEKHAAEIETWGRKSGSPSMKPNTMEDLYVEQAVPAEQAPQTAPAADTKEAASAPGEKPSATASKKSKKTPKTAPRTTASDKP